MFAATLTLALCTGMTRKSSQQPRPRCWAVANLASPGGRRGDLSSWCGGGPHSSQCRSYRGRRRSACRGCPRNLRCHQGHRHAEHWELFIAPLVQDLDDERLRARGEHVAERRHLRKMSNTDILRWSWIDVIGNPEMSQSRSDIGSTIRDKFQLVFNPDQPFPYFLPIAMFLGTGWRARDGEKMTTTGKRHEALAGHCSRRSCR